MRLRSRYGRPSILQPTSMATLPSLILTGMQWRRQVDCGCGTAIRHARATKLKPKGDGISTDVGKINASIYPTTRSVGAVVALNLLASTCSFHGNPCLLGIFL